MFAHAHTHACACTLTLVGLYRFTCDLAPSGRSRSNLETWNYLTSIFVAFQGWQVPSICLVNYIHRNLPASYPLLCFPGTVFREHLFFFLHSLPSSLLIYPHYLFLWLHKINRSMWREDAIADPGMPGCSGIGLVTGDLVLLKTFMMVGNTPGTSLTCGRTATSSTGPLAFLSFHTPFIGSQGRSSALPGDLFIRGWWT